MQYVSDMHALFKLVISQTIILVFNKNIDMQLFFSIFRASDSVKDDQLCTRIQIEFDTFVLRASNYVYLSRFLGAWQYLATLPFSEVHIATAWKLYYMLTSGFSKDLIENVTDST